MKLPAASSLLFLPLLALAGCGGSPGCDAAVTTEAVASYAGRYTASYTPTGASAATETLDLAVASDGFVTGTATVGAVAQAVVPTSQAGDLRNGCTLEGATFRLQIQDAGGVDTLFVSRNGQGSLVGTYSGTLTSNLVGTTGTLVVAKAATSG